MPVADVEQRGVHAQLLHRLAVHELQAQGIAVERERGVDVLDGHAHVVDPAEHGGQCIQRRRADRTSAPSA